MQELKNERTGYEKNENTHKENNIPITDPFSDYDSMGGLGTEAQAASANKYGTYTGSKPDKYSYTGNTVHVMPKKVFYSKSNGKLYYYAYVYNNTDKTIYGMKDLKITVRTSSNKKIASKTFYKGKKKK